MTGTSARRACAAALLVLAVSAPAVRAAGAPADLPAGDPPPGAVAAPWDMVPGPGGAGLGDRLYPGLGNGGYDALAYTVTLDYRGNARPMAASTAVDVRAARTLDRLNLDFAHGTVRSVRVGGRPAAFRREGEELVITPLVPVVRGTTARIEVAHTSDPRATIADPGWVRTSDGLVMANQADAAHRVFPCSDHPSDKARFTFRVTAPSRLTVVAGGLPRGRATSGGRTTWTYRTEHPVATELAQVSIGDSAVVRREGPRGLPLRDVVGRRDAARLEPVLARTPAQIAWMERRAGPFPLETYGVLSADATTGFALETQTLSLFPRDALLGDTRVAEQVMVHELAHQWFGDSVTPRTWSDLWLSEGHATWYEWHHAAERRDVDLTPLFRSVYAADLGLRRDGGPPAAPLPPGKAGKLGLFRGNVYAGGALVLYALRQEIGGRAFGELERAWVRVHRDSAASTSDFVALASRTAGRDLAPFLEPWLYGATTPPMPGHPDWKPGDGTDRSVPPPAHHQARRLPLAAPLKSG